MRQLLAEKYVWGKEGITVRPHPVGGVNVPKDGSLTAIKQRRTRRSFKKRASGIIRCRELVHYVKQTV